VFGRVVEGMDVVDKFNITGEGGKAEKIVTATVKRKRMHEYKPETIAK